MTRALSALLCAVLLAGLATPAAASTPPRHTATQSVTEAERRAQVVALLRRRLDRAYLSYRWVVCVDMKRSFHGHRVWRCNVDFGDPHIVQYCSIVIGQRLVTDREDRRLNCAPRA